MSTTTNYLPPEVIINGNPNIQTDTSFITPSTLCILGNINETYPTVTNTQVLSNGSTITITDSNLITGSLTLTTTSGTVLTENTDYTLTTDSTNSILTINITNSSINQQPTIISYQTLPENFWKPLKWWNLNTISKYYGAAWVNNTVNSPITAAATCAFQNGAINVCCIPYTNSTETLNLLNGGTSTGQTLETALATLLDEDDINIIIPVNSSQSDLETVQGFINQRNSMNNPIRGIMSLDGTTTTYSSTQLIGIAGTLNSFETLFIPNTIAQMTVNNTNVITNQPGWCYAAALGGLATTLKYYESMTRRTLLGFTPYNQYTSTVMNSLAAGGCCVLYSHNGSFLVRQSLSTYQNNLLDWSYSGVFNYLKENIAGLLESFIGEPSTDEVLLYIKSRMQLFFTQCKENNLIYDYTTPVVTRDANSPNVINVTFSAAWLNPIDYIQVDFTFNTQYGTSTSSIPSTDDSDSASATDNS